MQAALLLPLVAAGVSALVAVTGCEPPTAPAGPTPTAAQSPSVPERVVESGPTPSAFPSDTPAVWSGSPAAAGAVVRASAAATAAVTHAHVRYSTTGFESLTATAWGADVTTTPPAAKGSGQLLVDGRRAPTDFEVSGGRLTIENADGSHEDVGASRGVLDPPRILDPSIGLPALLSAATVTDTAMEQSVVDGVPTLRVRAQLPPAAAAVLLPPENVAGSAPLPVTLWLDPAAGNRLRQLVLNVGGGTVTVRLDTAGH